VNRVDAFFRSKYGGSGGVLQACREWDPKNFTSFTGTLTVLTKACCESWAWEIPLSKIIKYK
jgi:hypothetical protein